MHAHGFCKFWGSDRWVVRSKSWKDAGEMEKPAVIPERFGFQCLLMMLGSWWTLKASSSTEDSRVTVVRVMSYSAVRLVFFHCLVIGLSLEGSSGLFDLLVGKDDETSLSTSRTGNEVSEAPLSR